MNIKKVGTHSGSFHADDVVAFVILDELYGPLELVRSREDAILSTCDVVFDVGGGQYDHHTNDKEYRENGIPFAAAGLVWRDFGKLLLEKRGFQQDSINRVFNYIDEQYIQGLDAIDNGVRFKRELIIPDLTSEIQRFNPKWNKAQDENEQFQKAVQFARISFVNLLEDQLSRLEAVDIVKEAYTNRTQKELLVLEQHCPWQGSLMDMDREEEVKFVIYKDPRKGYLIQVVPVGRNTFEARKDLPEDWAGKDADELNQIIGIEDAIFAHPARFIAGAKSRESIMKMADLALKA
ncbi:MYG1 family protein [Bacillus sp. AK128]